MGEETGYLRRPDGAAMAYRRMAGRDPTVVWMGGFRSDMAGTKAQVLADWALARGQAHVRFDYFGHGESEGDFAQGTISRWREDALAVLDELASGPVVVVGSSMGGWLACLAALARPDQVQGLVLIAPAPDFTGKLMGPEIDAEARRSLAETGVWMRPSDHGEPYPISAALLEDGDRWSILPGPVPVQAPTRILQGGADPDVPWRHALELAWAIQTPDVVFQLITDGDHRLSRPQDLARLLAAVEELVQPPA